MNEEPRALNASLTVKDLEWLRWSLDLSIGDYRTPQNSRDVLVALRAKLAETIPIPEQITQHIPQPKMVQQLKKKPPLVPLLFHLERNEDETGISGTGRVAEGVVFSNGWCALVWLTANTSCAFYPNLATVEAIHGHNGKTQIVVEAT